MLSGGSSDLASSIKVLTMMVDVGSQGLNLQHTTYGVISMIFAKRSNRRVQVENRGLRDDRI